MSDNWQRYVDAAGDATRQLQHRAEAVVKLLVQQGESVSDRAEQAVDDLLVGSEAGRRALARLVTAETERVVSRLGLVPQAEVDELRAEVERLRGQIAAVPASGPAAAPPPAPARRPRRTAAERRVAADRGEATGAATPERTPPGRVASAAKPKPKPRPRTAPEASSPAGDDGPRHGPEAIATGAAEVGEARRAAPDRDEP